MARKASSKPDSGSSSTATIGFEADCCAFGIRHSDFVICSVWVQHFIQHLAPHGMAGVDLVCLRSASAVLADGSMSSNQSGEGDIRRALRN